MVVERQHFSNVVLTFAQSGQPSASCAERICRRDRKGDRSLPRKPHLSRYLREARIRRRLSVAEVAEQVGVSTASIYFWESDRVRPRDANLAMLCRVLRLPIRATLAMAAE